MKKNKLLKVYLNEEMCKKLAFVSQSEGVSVQNEISGLVRQKILYFERVKGNITSKNTADISLDAFEDI